MNVMRSLWASIQGDPMFMRRVNGWLTVFWVAMIPISLVTGWISSVTYIAALSLWALVSGHWSAWQAARVEVRQDEEARRAQQEPLEQRVVERLVEDTTVELARANERRWCNTRRCRALPKRQRPRIYRFEAPTMTIPDLTYVHTPDGYGVWISHAVRVCDQPYTVRGANTDAGREFAEAAMLDAIEHGRARLVTP